MLNVLFMFFFLKGETCGRITISNTKIESDPDGLTIDGSYSASGQLFRKVHLAAPVTSVEVTRTIEGTCSPQCCAQYNGETKYDRWGYWMDDGVQALMIDLDCHHVEFRVCLNGENACITFYTFYKAH